jgi:hypothetical protein
MVKVAGRRRTGLGRCCRLAVALMLAAAPLVRSLAVAWGLGQRTRAGDHLTVPTLRAPCTVLRAWPGMLPLRTLLLRSAAR